jgi:hypothetical protein
MALIIFFISAIYIVVIIGFTDLIIYKNKK